MYPAVRAKPQLSRVKQLTNTITVEHPTSTKPIAQPCLQTRIAMGAYVFSTSAFGPSEFKWPSKVFFSQKSKLNSQASSLRNGDDNSSDGVHMSATYHVSIASSQG